MILLFSDELNVWMSKFMMILSHTLSQYPIKVKTGITLHLIDEERNPSKQLSFQTHLPSK